MEIRIGIVDTPQTVAVTLADDADEAELKTTVEDALKGDVPVLWLTDENGRSVAVSSSRITHVEMVPPGSHRIGFG